MVSYIDFAVSGPTGDHAVSGRRAGPLFGVEADLLRTRFCHVGKSELRGSGRGWCGLGATSRPWTFSASVRLICSRTTMGPRREKQLPGSKAEGAQAPPFLSPTKMIPYRLPNCWTAGLLDSCCCCPYLHQTFKGAPSHQYLAITIRYGFIRVLVVVPPMSYLDA